MTSRLLGLLWFVCLPFVASAQVPQNNTSHAAAVAAAKELALDLKEARDLLKKVTDTTTRDRLELLITRSELKAIELEKALAGASLSTAGATPLSTDNFAKLLKGLKAETFDDGKLSFVATFATSGRLSCDQARQLLKEFSFDDDRVKAGVHLYPRLTDPENFFTVFDVFTFDSSRTSLREKLKLNKK